MKVLKFGGTSVANAQNIQLVIDIVKKQETKKLAVVVSALGGVTDLLLNAAQLAAQGLKLYETEIRKIESKHLEAVDALLQQPLKSEAEAALHQHFDQLETLLKGVFLLGELSDRTSDAISGMGELMSSTIIAKALQQQLDRVVYVDSRNIITTDSKFGKAKVDFEITNYQIQKALKSDGIYLLPGFVASSHEKHTTTLGRGGSDYTAAIVAAALEAEVLEIWTDVNGMYTANPKIVKQALPISEILYHEAMELSHFGAKVLYPPTIQPVLNKSIPILIKNTFEPEHPGTRISDQIQGNANPIKGITHIQNIALLTVEGSGIVGVSGFSKRLFEALSLENISAIFITQASSEHSICVGITEAEAKIAKQAIDKAFQIEIAQSLIDPTIVETHLSIVALVGEKMKNHQGISGKMFSTLGKNNVNIRAIAQGASERNISVVIGDKDVNKALNTLHERFFEDNTKQLNLFVMGVGNVGEKFMEQLTQQRKYLREQLKINLRLVGISNSRKMYFDLDGIPLKDWKNKLEEGKTADLEQFIAKAIDANLRNAIFVDNTASELVAATYANYLEKNIAVVTCNKIACASEYGNYSRLKALARKYSAPFLFETNVGAGLPIIDTLKHLITSGDKVNKIQAVLSGSLNFIFNNFNETNNFHDIVVEAGVQGFTEPDPKIDLSGIDVARKILILIRESGYAMEIEDIDNVSFLPEECLKTTSVPAFFESLKKHDKHFADLYRKAAEKGCRLKYVAEFENGKAKVGLQEIPATHDFYNLQGKDNIVLFYTDRYVDQPLIIKGAGAGAAVTASGIFADVIRIANV